MARFLIVAGCFGFVGVVLGAFGAHGLEGMLVSNGHLDTWQTATDYLFVHAIALFVLAAMPSESASALARWTGRFWVVGILIFSGSLYALSITGFSKLGMITPLGGLSFLAGWACLVLCAVRKSQPSVEKS